MLIAIISDTHLSRGSRALPEACMARLRAADRIFHAGDFSTLVVLQELRAIGPPLHAVHGNVDEPELRRRLPEAIELELDGSALAMIHDAGPARGRLKRLRARFPDADAVIFGHSHIPLHETGGDGLQIFNPGSPTERRRSPHHTMGLARIESRSISLEHVVL
jgi:putative phosphoesterase